MRRQKIAGLLLLHEIHRRRRRRLSELRHHSKMPTELHNLGTGMSDGASHHHAWLHFASAQQIDVSSHH
jgi:hypothetical protein